MLDKLKTKKSVLKRTKPGKDLPRHVLYLEWLGGTNQRRVIDSDKGEHVLDDKVVLSYYRLCTGGEAKRLIAEHWGELTSGPAPQPVVKAPDPSTAPAPKKAEAAPEKKAAKKTEKKAVTKKTAKKASKKATKKKTTKKAAKKKTTKKATKKKAKK